MSKHDKAIRRIEMCIVFAIGFIFSGVVSTAAGYWWGSEDVKNAAIQAGVGEYGEDGFHFIRPSVLQKRDGWLRRDR